MATNTIELDPAAAIGSQAASALMGFQRDGKLVAVDVNSFAAMRPSAIKDGILDFDDVTTTGFYTFNGGSTTLVNHPGNNPVIYGFIEVIKRDTWIMQRVTLTTSCEVYARTKTGDSSYVPWALISRGGVSTLYSINYQPTKRKGGRHERDNRPCDRANGHVFFRSVADWIEWLGRDEEDNAVQCSSNRLYNGFGRAEDTGELRCILEDVEHSEWRPQLAVDSHRGILSRRGHLSEDYTVLARGNSYKAVPTAKQRVAALESVHTILARKEAAV